MNEGVRIHPRQSFIAPKHLNLRRHLPLHRSNRIGVERVRSDRERRYEENDKRATALTSLRRTRETLA
jgi:hypothetical protein